MNEILDSIIEKNSHITDDSRSVQKDGIFIAVEGNKQDGHSHILDAVQRGARLVIINKSREALLSDLKLEYLSVDNTRVALSYLASKLYKRPDDIVAVTGTNGKTSVAYFFSKILSLLNQDAAYIGTLGVITTNNSSGFEKYNSLTTPGTIALNEILDALKRKNFNKVALEASSHGLDQHRLDYINFKAAAFTEFGRDHLDYHQDLKSYFAAKLILFESLLPAEAFAVINADMEPTQEIIDVCKRRKLNILSYGYNGDFAKILSIENQGLNMIVSALIDNKKHRFPINLFGDFQAYNAICAMLLVHSIGFKIDDCLNALEKLTSVPGRMERVNNYNIFVDYAHTHDALEGVLKVVRNSHHKKGKLILIFGCGGDRDKGKRPLMGGVAATYADTIIVTDDNPRTEDPAQIRKEIIAKCPNSINIGDREEAIKYAIQHMQAEDILLIAGKGHESTQTIGSKVIEFDDRKIAQKYAELYLT